MKKIKILLVENEVTPFQEMFQVLDAKLGHIAEIYPKMTDNPDAGSYLYFIEEYVERLDFTGILQQYPDIDVFVIDVFLRENDENDNGLNLGKLIEENYPDKNVKIIYTSNAKYTREMYVWKGESNYANRICDRIIDLYKDAYEEEQRLTGNESSHAGTVAVVNKSNSLRNKIAENIRRHGYADTCYRGIYWAGDKLKRCIHVFITTVFFLLILVTAIYAAGKIYEDFNPWGSAELPVRPNGLHTAVQDTASRIQKPMVLTTADYSNVEDTMILKHAEHIFLYLLPIFIVFGFYIYYKTNTSIYFLGGKIDKVDQENSTRSMNLTKIIFISSIISYTLIKMIDKIFFEKNVSLLILVSSGILLIVLIIYLILISRKGH